MYGGVRFGGTLTIEDAWAYGFDHIAIATGAGRPTIVDMKNNLIRGIRQGVRFPDGAAAHRRVQEETRCRICRCALPAVVIGGGLTGIDTATELFAYYPVQVEKMLEAVRHAGGRSSARRTSARYTTRRSCELLDEFLEHGRAVRLERERADRGRRSAEFRSAGARLGRRVASLSQAPGQIRPPIG